MRSASSRVTIAAALRRRPGFVYGSPQERADGACLRINNLRRCSTRRAPVSERAQCDAAGQVALKRMSPLEFMQIQVNVRFVAGRSTGSASADGRLRSVAIGCFR